MKAEFFLHKYFTQKIQNRSFCIINKCYKNQTTIIFFSLSLLGKVRPTIEEILDAIEAVQQAELEKARRNKGNFSRF